MSKWSKMRYAVCGFLVGAVFWGSVAFAATSTIEVSFDPVKFIVNHVDKTPVNNEFNNNGTIVPASIIYSGTTYVPLRLVSNMLGEHVAWDGPTRSVLIGDSVVGGDYLSDMAPSNVGQSVFVNEEMQLDGQTYEKGLSFYTSANGFGIPRTGEHKQSYHLNAQYDKLSFIYGMSDDTANQSSSRITILGDGKEIWTSNAVRGVPAQDASIPVSGILELEIVVTNPDGSSRRTLIVNPILSKE